MEALQFPSDKRAHRLFPMEKEGMLEITMIEGHTIEARKKLIRLLFDKIRDQVNIQHQDVEICIQEQLGFQRHAW